jgi:predicted ATPase
VADALSEPVISVVKKAFPSLCSGVDLRGKGDGVMNENLVNNGLARVHIRNLASIDEVELCPGRLTVLIGPNGSGKSNILKALKLVLILQTQLLQRFVGESGGAATLLHYGPKKTADMELELEFHQEEKKNVYSVRLGYAASDTLIFLDEVIGYDDGTLHESGFMKTSLGTGHRESKLREARSDDPTAEAVNYWLSQLASITSTLRTNAKAADDRFLRSDGSNLAAYLLSFSQGKDETSMKVWRRINRLVHKIAPCIKELAPTPMGKNDDYVRLDWIDDQNERFGVHQLSDGSLRAIALITALAQPTKQLPKFIGIDEPELGLHPTAISVLIELARSVSHHTQVFFATQSTAFLDHFEPDEVIVTERKNGATKLKNLSTIELKKWLADYSLSEIFNKGVIGGRP